MKNSKLVDVPLPAHPQPKDYAWTVEELQVIQKYGNDRVKAVLTFLEDSE